MSRNRIFTIFVLLTSSVLLADSMSIINSIQMGTEEVPLMVRFVFKCARTAQAILSRLTNQNNAVTSDSNSIQDFSFNPLSSSVRDLNRKLSLNRTDGETTALPENISETATDILESKLPSEEPEIIEEPSEDENNEEETDNNEDEAPADEETAEEEAADEEPAEEEATDEEPAEEEAADEEPAEDAGEEEETKDNTTKPPEEEEHTEEYELEVEDS